MRKSSLTLAALLLFCGSAFADSYRVRSWIRGRAVTSPFKLNLQPKPWSRYPIDLGHNFVLAHAGCNGAKAYHTRRQAMRLGRWVERNRQTCRWAKLP